MISCTEFIPLYSEFFKFLEERNGPDAVMEYWIHISDTSIGDKTNPNSMAYKCERLGGFKGAGAYWGHTVTEEACDTFSLRSTKVNCNYSHMRRCPSRAMLNSLTHIEPYHNYCEHCKIIYSRVLEKYGVVYERDQSKVDNAECCSVLYEKDTPPEFDWRNITDDEIKEKFSDNPDYVISECKREGQKYLHRDFHLLADNALKYCGDKYGDDEVVNFISDYTKNYYSPQINEFKKEGLSALKAWIEKIYEIEEASDILHAELKDNMLTVIIDKSPVIEYMKSLNQKPSKYYIEETRTLYDVIARESGFKFNLEYYNEDGASKFTFKK